MTRDYVLFYINGERHQVSGEQVYQPLSDFLRYEQRLVGTKVVCAEGDCGACSILLGKSNGRKLVYETVNSCIQYVYQLDCQHVVTVEGLKRQNQLHPVQQAMVDHFGSQCGYCTPGFVVAMAGMVENQQELTQANVQEGLTGNLCRCTGYRAIVSAALSVDPATVPPMSKFFPEKAMLQDFADHQTQSIALQFEDNLVQPAVQKRYFNPTTVEETVQLREKHPEAMMIAGGTDISVQMNKDRLAPNTVISLSNVTGLYSLEEKDGYLHVGAKVSWTALENYCAQKLPAFQKILQVFASPQIKNVGTLAGNIANGSPIADSLPFLYVTNAEVELTEVEGTRWVNINQFYHGYKKMEMQSNEMITDIRIPLPKKQQILKLYKVSKRKDLDISTFTAGIFMELRDQAVKSIRIAFGGVGPVVLRLHETEKLLTGKRFSLETFQGAAQKVQEEITPISDVRASSTYRFQLSANTMMKFFHEIADEFPALAESNPNEL